MTEKEMADAWPRHWWERTHHLVEACLLFSCRTCRAHGKKCSDPPGICILKDRRAK